MKQDPSKVPGKHRVRLICPYEGVWTIASLLIQPEVKLFLNGNRDGPTSPPFRKPGDSWIAPMMDPSDMPPMFAARFCGLTVHPEYWSLSRTKTYQGLRFGRDETVSPSPDDDRRTSEEFDRYREYFRPEPDMAELPTKELQLAMMRRIGHEFGDIHFHGDRLLNFVEPYPGEHHTMVCSRLWLFYVPGGPLHDFFTLDPIDPHDVWGEHLPPATTGSRFPQQH